VRADEAIARSVRALPAVASRLLVRPDDPAGLFSEAHGRAKGFPSCAARPVWPDVGHPLSGRGVAARAFTHWRGLCFRNVKADPRVGGYRPGMAAPDGANAL
jgi:hypothetical protein